MRALFYRILVLLAVIGLIAAPPVLTGYDSLHQADAADETYDYMRAAVAYERAAILLPWRSDLWERAGVAQVQARNFVDAIRLLEIAKQRDALSDVGWAELGVSYFVTDRLYAALETWENGLKAYPYYARYYYHLTFAYREQGNTPAEKDALERWVLSEGATDAGMHYRLGQLLSISDPERALGEFLLASSLDSECDSAVETMRIAFNLASLETDESRRLVIIGRGLGLVNEWALAEQAFRQAVEADGKNAEAWAWLGEAWQQLDQDGRAALDKALSLGRANPTVRSLRGLYWTRQGRPQQALDEYLLAAEFEPDNPLWQVSVGDAYARLGDLPPALDAYLRAVEMAPGDATYWRLLAVFCAQYGVQIEEIGLPAAQKAIALAPEDPQALDALGSIFLSLGRPDEACYHLSQALELEPDFALAHLHFGIASLQLNDRLAAFGHFTRACELDVGGAAGEQARLLLNQYFP